MRRNLIALAVAAATLTPATPAFADWTQPYGGCDEAWQAPRSAGADACRDHGWTVRTRLVVNNHGRVAFHTMPSCPSEDAGRFCSWNINPGDGNGRGDAFWRDSAGRATYVWVR